MKCRRANIAEFCMVERAVPGKVYRAGSCYIKLSAVDDSVGQLKTAGCIENRYAVLEPKANINVAYLYIAVSRAFPEFLRRYRTTINLQFDTLKHFEVDWHDSESCQEYVVRAIETVQMEINIIEKQIEQEKEVKRWYLEMMLV